MIRTRDFTLFLVSVLFLVTGILGTVAYDVRASVAQTGSVLTAVAPAGEVFVEHEAVIPESPELDRGSLLMAMRDKVAALGLGTPPVVEEEVPVTEEASSGEPVADTPVTTRTCPQYTEVSWSSVPGVLFREVEGARIVYRPSAGMDAVLGTVLPEVVVAQLPLRTSPVSAPACIPYDVIGIATDGSLIRNHEVPLYAVFGGDTLVGYALDGFPIYGTNSTAQVDECGGGVVNGMYRYYVDRDRETVIGCFAGGVPVSL